VAVLGLKMADLFAGPSPSGQTRLDIVATYDYRDLTGSLAQKVRLRPKGFRWRRPDMLKPGAWRWGLAGMVPGLYRLTELMNVERVFLTEGEKAVDLLWSLGLPATCPPAGASKWSPAWSMDLWKAGCRVLVILPDRDRAGERHALRVADATYALQIDEPLQVKVVALPRLEFGEDAFDWLHAGRTPAGLIALAADAPWWSPGATEGARADRRRMLTRARVRRYRERERERRRRAATEAA